MNATTVLDRARRAFFGGGKPLADLVVTVYSREGCGCCERALGVLEQARRREGFVVEVVDVDRDEALREAYGTMVPVVAVDGKVRFKGKVDPPLLERLIRAERTKRGGPDRAAGAH